MTKLYLPLRMDIQVKMPDNSQKHLAEVDYRVLLFEEPNKEKPKVYMGDERGLEDEMFIQK